MWKARDEERKFKFVKIKTHVLKVHIHCQGCMRKVKKLLRKVEGVYEVKIEAGEHKVTVSGKVDCMKLIEKLAKSGKHAEIWKPPQSNGFRNEAYLNKQQSPMDGQDPFDYQPLPVHPRDENIPRWEFESHLKNNHRAGAQMGENMWARDKDIISDKGGMGYNTSFPGYYAPGQFDRLKNIYAGSPVYEYQYQLPAVMDNMQGPWYNNYPYSMMYTNMPNMHPVSNNMMEKIYAFN